MNLSVSLILFYLLRDFKESKNKWRDDAKSVRKCVGLLELDSHSDDNEVINNLRIQMFPYINSTYCSDSLCSYSLLAASVSNHTHLRTLYRSLVVIVYALAAGQVCIDISF